MVRLWKFTGYKISLPTNLSIDTKSLPSFHERLTSRAVRFDSPAQITAVEKSMKKLAITVAIASLLLTSCSGTPSQSDRSDNLENLPPQIGGSAEQKNESTEEPVLSQPQPKSDGAPDAGDPSAEVMRNFSEDALDEINQQAAEPEDSSGENGGDGGRDDSTNATSVGGTPEDRQTVAGDSEGAEGSGNSEGSDVAVDETGTTVSDEDAATGAEEPRKRWRLKR